MDTPAVIATKTMAKPTDKDDVYLKESSKTNIHHKSEYKWPNNFQFEAQLTVEYEAQNDLLGTSF